MTQKTINVTLAVTYSYDTNDRFAKAFAAGKMAEPDADPHVDYADYVRESVASRVVNDVVSHMHTVEDGVSLVHVERVDDFEV